MKITVTLTTAEYLALRALAVECGLSSSEILQQFASDLAQSPRSGGSDEREMALAYVRRCNYAWRLHGPADDPAVAKNAARARKWKEAAQWALSISHCCREEAQA